MYQESESAFPQNGEFHQAEVYEVKAFTHMTVNHANLFYWFHRNSSLLETW